MKNEKILATLFLLFTLLSYFIYLYVSADKFNWYLVCACFLPLVIIHLSDGRPKIVKNPVSKVLFDDERMFVKNHRFEKDQIEKVVVDLAEDYAVFALPYNKVNGRTVELYFKKERFGMFRQYLESNLPDAKIIT